MNFAHDALGYSIAVYKSILGKITWDPPGSEHRSGPPRSEHGSGSPRSEHGIGSPRSEHGSGPPQK